MGTRFNINAYADEKLVRATLVNGTIAVRAGESSKILKPGEQATVEQAIGIIKVDVHAATAWKDGYFLFNGADIQTVMRQIGRWYNVDVIFEGKFTNTAVSALVSRKKNADEVLKILEGSGYSFLISEDLNKITVLHRREIKL
jgi:ferric-dicitrate binding protein FerR (iron transport regulator)